MSETGSASGPSLLDEARALTSRRGSVCTVERLFIHHPEIAADLREALRADVTSAAITAALKRRGIDVGSETLGRHRRGVCRCQE